MTNKKEIERFYLDEFFKVLRTTPDDVQGDESPDFVVKLKGKIIGLEVTEYHSTDKGEKGRPRRLIEETWAELQKEIMGEVRKHRELKQTSGWLGFRKLSLPSKIEYRQFIEELIKIAHEMVRSNREESKPGPECKMLNKYLRKFYLRKVGFYISWEWSHSAASIGLSEEELLNSVKPKLVNYRDASFDELWLLVVSGVRLSQTMPVHLSYKLREFQTLESFLKKSEYDNVYIFQYQLGVAYEWPEWVKIGKEKLIATILDDKAPH